MKLLFSEAAPDPVRYVYPYAVWAFLEPGETPADAFAAGFLPGSPQLDRFYLTRQLRVPLVGWTPTSENRRMLRKAEALRCELVPRSEFAYTAGRRDGWLAYADAKWGAGVLSPERLDRLMSGAVVSHVLHFTDIATGEDRGSVLMYLEAPTTAFYYYAFYRPGPETKHVGMAMMVRAVEHFARSGFAHLHLGTCYTEPALYKAQFEPMEFFNGFRWSRDLEELRHLVRTAPDGRHRLETPEFLAFQPGPPAELAQAGIFRAERVAR